MYLISALILLALSVRFYIKGVFMTKIQLADVSPINEYREQTSRKVVLLMIDALREDFVEMPEGDRYLDSRKSAYRGARVRLFNDKMIEEPQNTILLPLESEMPTVTMMRVKGMMTGGLSAYMEISENFGSDRV